MHPSAHETQPSAPRERGVSRLNPQKRRVHFPAGRLGRAVLKGWPLESGRYDCGSRAIANCPHATHCVTFSTTYPRLSLTCERIINYAVRITKETLHGTSRHAFHDFRSHFS